MLNVLNYLSERKNFFELNIFRNYLIESQIFGCVLYQKKKLFHFLSSNKSS
jgi:hypothetical protein